MEFTVKTNSTCYVVIGRPTDSTQVKIFKKCLETLQGKTVVCSVNYLTEEFLTECKGLYNGLVYSDKNEVIPYKSFVYMYDKYWKFERNRSIDHGYAVLSLYIRGINWAINQGFENFVLVNFDTYFNNPKIFDLLESTSNLFISGNNVNFLLDDYNIVDTWLMKVNLEGYEILKHLANSQTYLNYLNQNKLLERMVYDEIKQKIGIIDCEFFTKDDLLKYDIWIDQHRFLNVAKTSNNRLVGIFSSPSEYKEEYTIISETMVYNLGNLQGLKYFLDLGEYKPQNLKVIVNDLEYSYKIDDDLLNNSSIEFLVSSNDIENFYYRYLK
jgi:hypothetical protein